MERSAACLACLRGVLLTPNYEPYNENELNQLWSACTEAKFTPINFDLDFLEYGRQISQKSHFL